MHIRLFFGVLALTSCCVPAMGNAGRHASPGEFDHSAAWRAAAAHVLEAQEDPGSLATAAALVVAGAPARSKAETPRAAAAVEDAVRASDDIHAIIFISCGIDVPGSHSLSTCKRGVFRLYDFSGSQSWQTLKP